MTRQPDRAPGESWQDRLDREFPRGALCSWDYGRGGHRVVYKVPRIVVTGEDGGYPVVALPSDTGRLLGPWQVASYDDDGHGPGLKRVTFERITEPMTWSPAVPDRLAHMMKTERDRLLREGLGGSETGT